MTQHEPSEPPAAFDPRRPLDRELDASVTDGFTFAAVGDCITSRPLLPSIGHDPGLARTVDLLRGATATFGNLETSIVDVARFRHYPRVHEDWSLVASPAVAQDLAALGFGLVGRGNNHVLDWDVGGMHETGRHLDRAGVVHAGAGGSLASARAARYLETAGGRVGVVSFHTTERFEPSAALDQHNEVPARPGLNGIRLRRRLTVPEATFEGLREIARLFDPEGTWERYASEGPGTVNVFDTTFRVGERTELRYEPYGQDVEGNLLSIRQGKQFADLLVVSAHVHQEGPDGATPPPFLVDLAHATIDAGADVFVGHGVHRLWPVEIYRGRPIFYGLGNFIFSDIQEPMVRAFREEGAEALRRGLGERAEDATDAEINLIMNAQGFDDPRYFESVLAQVEFRDATPSIVRLHPVDLGYGRRLTESGIPRIADAETSSSILKRLQAASEPFGTSIAIADDGTGSISV
ncbi:MAG: CapA family protein [Actinomycetota bacterium]